MKNVIKLAMFAAITGLLGTGCATTSVTKSATAAPITYKIGHGDSGAQYASLNLPKSKSRPALPRYVTPRAVTPLGSQGPVFDPSKVDRQLYSHQKVGKRYTVMGKSYTPRHNPDYDKSGKASWYGPGFHGKPTATGEIFNKRAMTAAHKTLPLNSILFVTNMDTGKTIKVRLNDRGPFIGNRIIDLSEAAAEALGFKANGIGYVRVRYAGPADPMAAGRTVPTPAPRLAELPRENIAPKVAPVIPNPVVPAPIVPAPVVPQFAEPTLPAPIAPSAPVRTPDADLPDGGKVTLTIKGPIHIARSDETTQPPRFISERLVTR